MIIVDSEIRHLLVGRRRVASEDLRVGRRHVAPNSFIHVAHRLGINRSGERFNGATELTETGLTRRKKIKLPRQLLTRLTYLNEEFECQMNKKQEENQAAMCCEDNEKHEEEYEGSQTEERERETTDSG